MDAEQSLLERIAKGQPRTRTDPNVERVRASVLWHLRRLLNTRQGSAPACPQYGLPDLIALTQEGKDPQPAISKAIEQAIDAFEPRLKVDRVITDVDPQQPSRLRFRVSGRLVYAGFNEPFACRTSVERDGRLLVED